MKRFVTGLIAGIALTISVSAYADEIESYIGKVIEGQFPVVIDGKKAEKPGIVVDGTTYLPVRSAGELFGYNISFIDSEVVMKKKTTKTVENLFEALEEDTQMMTSPMGNEFDFNKIGMRGIDGYIRIHEARLMIMAASEHAVAQAEVPILREEIQFWQDIKALKEAELAETP